MDTICPLQTVVKLENLQIYDGFYRAAIQQNLDPFPEEEFQQLKALHWNVRGRGALRSRKTRTGEHFMPSTEKVRNINRAVYPKLHDILVALEDEELEGNNKKLFLCYLRAFDMHFNSLHKDGRNVLKRFPWIPEDDMIVGDLTETPNFREIYDISDNSKQNISIVKTENRNPSISEEEKVEGHRQVNFSLTSDTTDHSVGSNSQNPFQSIPLVMPTLEQQELPANNAQESPRRLGSEEPLVAQRKSQEPPQNDQQMDEEMDTKEPPHEREKERKTEKQIESRDIEAESQQIKRALKNHFKTLKEAKKKLEEIKQEQKDCDDSQQDQLPQLLRIEKEKNAKLSEVLDRIKQLKSSRKNNLACFGVRTPEILEEIQRQHRRFKVPPIGPVGRYIKLLQNQWAKPIELCLTPAVLCSYIVDNYEDRKLLRNILIRYATKDRIPLIMVQKFPDRPYDLSDNTFNDVGIYRVVDRIEVQNTWAKNVLIDQTQCERYILLEWSGGEGDQNGAFEFLKRNRGNPLIQRKLDGVWTKDGCKVVDRNGRSIAATYHPHDRRFLNIDYESELKALNGKRIELQNELGVHDNDRRRLTVLRNEASNEKRALSLKYMAVENDIRRTEDTINDLQRQLDVEQGSHDESSDHSNTQQQQEGLEDLELKILRQTAKIAENRQKAANLRDSLSEYVFQCPNSVEGFDKNAVKGLLGRLIRVKDEKFVRALQSIASGHLFKVVVNSHKVVPLLVKTCEKRTTFIPLDLMSDYKRLSVEKVTEAQRLVGGEKVNLAIGLIEYEPELEPVMWYVFGSTFVCDNSWGAWKLAFQNPIAVKSVDLEGNIFDPHKPNAEAIKSPFGRGKNFLVKLTEIDKLERMVKREEEVLTHNTFLLEELKRCTQMSKPGSTDIEMLDREITDVCEQKHISVDQTEEETVPMDISSKESTRKRRADGTDLKRSKKKQRISEKGSEGFSSASSSNPSSAPSSSSSSSSTFSSNGANISAFKIIRNDSDSGKMRFEIFGSVVYVYIVFKKRHILKVKLSKKFFDHLNKTHPTWNVVAARNNRTSRFYARISQIDYKGMICYKYLHRVVMEYVTKRPIPQGCHVHHRNFDGLDNMIHNLQVLTVKQNARARRQKPQNAYISKAMRAALDS